MDQNTIAALTMAFSLQPDSQVAALDSDYALIKPLNEAVVQCTGVQVEGVLGRIHDFAGDFGKEAEIAQQTGDETPFRHVLRDAIEHTYYMVDPDPKALQELLDCELISSAITTVIGRAGNSKLSS